MLVDAGVQVTDADSAAFEGGWLRASFAEESGRDTDRLAIRNTEMIVVDGMRHTPAARAWRG